MPIEFACACGKSLRAPEASAGKRARCPKCQAVVTVPAASVVRAPAAPAANEYELQEVSAGKAALGGAVALPARAVVQKAVVAEAGFGAPGLIMRRSVKTFAYWLLLLAFIPLAISSFRTPTNMDDEIKRSVMAHPEVIERLEAMEKAAVAQHPGINGEPDDSDGRSMNEVLALFPAHRLDSALLAFDSHNHWFIALAAAGAYFVFLLVAFPQAPRYAKGLLFAGLFTGTAGIVLLLGIQWAAFSLPAIRVRGSIGLILLVIQLIGYSYVLAESNVGFFLSFLGFTCGVGLCEEITKALPLLFRIKPIPGEEDPSWNSLLLWGLASGIGFGIAEGIMYSGRYYNGTGGVEIYVVRFVSCVFLHAIWSGAVGIAMYRRQQWLLDAESKWGYFFRLIQIVLVPMVLHGLYDTLLKKEHEFWALGVAVVSFGWLMFQIERHYRSDPLVVGAAG